jgi:Fe-S oxidoreductase
MMISQKEGLVADLKALKPSTSSNVSGSSAPVTLTLHHACHSRAQNNGFKARELLRLIPNLNVMSIERCSGHGGTFGVKRETYPVAIKVGKVLFQKTKQNLDKTIATGGGRIDKRR